MRKWIINKALEGLGDLNDKFTDTRNLPAISNPNFALTHLSKAGDPLRRAGCKSRCNTKYLSMFLPYLDKTMWSRAELSDIPHEHWINIQTTISGWLSRCEKFHAHCTVDTNDDIKKYPGGIGPQYLIDVQDQCLVKACNEHEYFALSYSWGDNAEADTKTTSGNLERLQQNHSLARNQSNTHAMTERLMIPKLIYDSIDLVHLLGYRYLWVDRLCIVQDMPEEKRKQLNAMAEIYLGAYATIVSAHVGITRDGLYGIQSPDRGNTRERPSLQDILDARQRVDFSETLAGAQTYFGTERWHQTYHRNLEIMYHYQEAFTKSSELDWYRRGWTFQEMLFSRRKIIFQKDTVNWECHCSCWHEQMVLTDDNASEEGQVCDRSQWIKSDSEHWPDMYRLARLVSLYNSRNFTHPQDVQKVMAGTFTWFSRTIPGKIINGLPEIFFDDWLIWQNWEPLPRRKTGQQAGSSSYLSSWSWVGWSGAIDSTSLRSSYDYICGNPDEYWIPDPNVQLDCQPCSWHTESTVSWHYKEHQSNIWIRIDPFGHKFRACSWPPEHGVQFDRGWTRHLPTAKRDQGLPPYFSHEKIPGQNFWYPIPLPGADDKPRPPIVTAFLRGETRVVNTLTIGDRIENGVWTTFSVDLLDSNSEWAGFLRLNLPTSGESVSNDLFPSVPTKNEKIKLIELSKGTVGYHRTEKVSFDEWNRVKNRIRPNRKYEFYNVMLVEKHLDYYTRVAVGRVIRSAWEKAPRISEDIVLYGTLPLVTEPDRDVFPQASDRACPRSEFFWRRKSYSDFAPFHHAISSGRKAEVVISAGALHTPTILQRSGIGPASFLKTADIPVVLDLPGVGSNFQDHSGPRMSWNYSRPGNFLNTPLDMLDPAYAAKAVANFNMVPALGPYTLAMGNTAIYVSLPNMTADYMAIIDKMRTMAADDSAASYLPADSDLTLIAGYKRQLSVLADFLSNPQAPSLEVPFATGTGFVNINLHPLSRGTVRINPSNHLAQPILDYRTGSNPIDFDVYLAHLRYLRRTFTTPTMQKYGAAEVAPGASIRSDAALLEYTKETMGFSYMHPCCTAAMMPKQLGGVVGPDLKVHGAPGLRVVDISVLPFLTSSHTSSVAYAVREKAADIIIEVWRE
ncbi:hypothetical protein BDW02DRAFT_635312 [Decorospora gaudefroyi]|uniref:Glucose-methanol-choline oxidoreductase N-terminal domain-containing protein n=1 Tax=Decorospora gaudefroyi TaxID=184978 RepID=A0A6A5JV90_9PLEO|nr:hypothetical protein BDW02DRAFT_635312 [Decorospora gaudefroyi]